MSEYKVSILMMTYNQGRFIAQAIDSVIHQDLSFSWQLIIGDDCSTDNTEEIVKFYLEKYPSKISYYRNSLNLGLHKNYISLIKKVKGEFVALLEADDYWIDSNKLQKQIELLDSNSQMAWCFTDGLVVDDTGVITKKITYTLPAIFDLSYYIANFFNPLNNTIVFRKIAEPVEYPNFFSEVAQWDTVLHYLRSLKGTVGYLQIESLAWRRHPEATSFTLNFSGEKRYLDWIKMNKGFQKVLPIKYKNYFEKNYVAYENLALLAIKKQQKVKFFRYFILMLKSKMFRPIKEYRDFCWKLMN